MAEFAPQYIQHRFNAAHNNAGICQIDIRKPIKRWISALEDADNVEKQKNIQWWACIIKLLLGGQCFGGTLWNHIDEHAEIRREADPQHCLIL